MLAAVLGPGSTLGTSAPLVRAEAGDVSFNELDQDGVVDMTLPLTSLIHADDLVAISSRNGDNAPVATGANLTFLNGLAIILSLQIGTGIFSAPSQVSNHVSSPAVGVLVWLFVGLFVWTGAASFIELGLAVPMNRWVQEYLWFCYGDFLGILFTMT